MFSLQTLRRHGKKQALSTLANTVVGAEYRTHPTNESRKGIAMSEILNGKPPVSFWIVGGVFLTWNLIGLMFYYMQVTMTPEVMAANLNDTQIAFMNNTPLWATSAYAIAVNAGVIGALLLLLRKKWALNLFVLSFAGVLVQDFDAFVLSGAIDVWGTSAVYLPTVVIIICVAEIWYSRSVANRYYR